MNHGKTSARAMVPYLVGIIALVGFLIGTLMVAGAQTEDGAGLRVVHVGIDTPPVNVTVNGESFAEGLFWLEATEYTDVPAGDHEVAIFDPDTSLDEALATMMITTEAGNNYSAVITGEMPAPTIILLVDGAEGGVEAGMGAARFFHSVPDAGAVDVATSDGTVLVEGLATMTASDYVMVPAGAHDIEFREAGTENVLYTEAGVMIEEAAFQTTYLSGLAELTNFAAETFIDEYRADADGGEPTATEEAGMTATEDPNMTATEEPDTTATATGEEATATPEPAQPTATPEPEPTATATPVPALPSTGAGGLADGSDGGSTMLVGILAALCLAAGGGLFFMTRRLA